MQPLVLFEDVDQSRKVDWFITTLHDLNIMELIDGHSAIASC